MLSSVGGGEPRGEGRPVQAGCGPESNTSGLRRRLTPTLAPVVMAMLAGCSSFPSAMNPVSWWHDLQGGKIADERPPPPGADEPYPNLASVPPKPEPPDRAALENIANALIADRTNAQHMAEAAPIADPSLPSASPGLFGRGTVPPPPPPPPQGTVVASASMPAAETPVQPPSPPPPVATPVQATPVQATPPVQAPVGPVGSTPLAPPGVTLQPPAEPPAPSPVVAAAPPPPPNLPGMVATPSPPPQPPPTPAALPTPTPPAGVAAPALSVSFEAGSATLPSAAADSLRQLAARRGSAMIAVTGYGDAASNDPTAQSIALTLGLSRAQAMAAALAKAGVPPAAVQVDAAAIGRGGAARLVQ